MESLKLISGYSFEKIKNYSIFFIYIFVNGLFVIKYGEKYGMILLPVYLIAVLVLSVFYIKVEFKETIYKVFFWISLISFFIASICLNYIVDGKSLKVDRWDAMEIGIRAILEGKYPYNIPDYMGRKSSNLPVLIILGMPFYLIFGSVGYLQSFTFLLFSYIIFKIFNVYKHRLAVLVLLLLSPSYLWEVYVKSDLFSNFILAVAFVYLLWNYFIKKSSIKLELAAFLTALLFLTRLSVVIPIIILLFGTFLKFSLAEKFRFILVFLLTVLCILGLFFYNASDVDMIIKYNPFVIQNAKQPLILSLLYIITAFALSFRVKSFYDIMFWSGILLFICVLIPFVLYLKEYGYNNVMVSSYFDLSFFNMSMPFIIIVLVLGFWVNNHKENTK
ncbi:hypothetical protein MUU74_00930 [Chryseobacterium daecheongense]|uniref:hypothetical protein n=1 Tax=Chryseobacterium daecheongense TaxID=192389 RepID=UPI001FD72482|nr:hypothetical protein [Chryseobacterium daecheongense]UOU98547.1 hypothetical protein MUU74_00930 [Chryseobacterium daecheongense]